MGIRFALIREIDVKPFPSLPLDSCASKTPRMSAPENELLRAVELALAGEWDAAHNLVQKYEGDATAAWIHAVLHKQEGDLGNARYWYHHADRINQINAEPGAELEKIRLELSR